MATKKKPVEVQAGAAKVRVFLSWSGSISRQVARALREHLPMVIQALDPWMSEKDIDAGGRWNEEISRELENTNVGIICLTPENLSSTWLHFESGAIAKSVDESRACTYLFNLEHNNVEFPLAQFQHVKATRDGTLKLIETLNKAISEPLPEGRLKEIFEMVWPKLEKALGEITSPQGAGQRGTREVLDEILELTRSLVKDATVRTSLAKMSDDVLAKSILDHIRASFVHRSDIAVADF